MLRWQACFTQTPQCSFFINFISMGKLGACPGTFTLYNLLQWWTTQLQTDSILNLQLTLWHSFLDRFRTADEAKIKCALSCFMSDFPTLWNPDWSRQENVKMRQCQHADSLVEVKESFQMGNFRVLSETASRTEGP